MSKGFYIEVSNGLLEPEHRKRMGSAVWEFMWLLDKITKIDDQGTGWVLGGKPLTGEEMQVELGIYPDHILDNLKKLETEEYIKTKRTPYGQIIWVLKAKKRFGHKALSDEPKRMGDKALSTSLKALSTSLKALSNKTVQETVSGDKAVIHPADEEELIPIDDGAPIKTGRGEIIKRLVYWAETKSGNKIINRGATDKAISKMLQGGYTENQIKTKWEELEQEEWITSGISFALVAGQIDKQKVEPKKKKPSILVSPDAKRHENI